MQTQDQNCFRFAFVIIVIKERAGARRKLETSQNSNLDDSGHLEFFKHTNSFVSIFYKHRSKEI